MSSVSSKLLYPGEQNWAGEVAGLRFGASPRKTVADPGSLSGGGANLK
jgi:hypothetical protein